MIYVISPKSAYAAKRLKIEATLRLRSGPNGKPELRIMDLKDLIACNFKLTVHHGDTLYVRNPYLNGSPKYIPHIIKLAKRFKKQGGRVVDENIANGDLGRGKWRDYQKLKKAGLPIPQTKVFKSYLLPATHYPLILKWIYGLKGKGTFLIKSEKDIKKIPSYIPRKELMIQEFVRAKYEYKVITVGYKALPVVLKFKIQNSKFRINFTGYEIVQSRVISRIIQIAQKASKVLGRELAKVDILEKDGKLFILEVNRFPGLESFEKLTKFNAIKEFLRYLM